MSSPPFDDQGEEIAAAALAEPGPVLASVGVSIPSLPRASEDISSRLRLRISQRIAGDLVALADVLAVGAAAAFVQWFTAFNHLATASQASDLVLYGPAVAVITALAFRCAGLNEMRTLMMVARQGQRLLFVWMAVVAIAVPILTFFYHVPPLILLAWLCLAPASILSARAGLTLLYRLLLERGVMARRVAVIGNRSDLEAAATLVHQDRLTQISGVFALPEGLDEEMTAQHVTEIMNELALGDYDDIVVLVPSLSDEGVEALISHLAMLPARIALLPVVALRTLDVVEPGDLDALSITVAEKPVRGWSIILKSLFDYLVASAMLAVFALPMIVIAVAIKLESKGPVFFRQQRRGLGGRLFKIWKFRSMHVLEDGDTIEQAKKEDGRVTRVGRIIRRSSLDELPQIFNVFASQMSVVGPRPHARAHDDYYSRLIADYRFRFRVKPGISGWAQVHGWRGETRTVDDMAQRVSYDVEYAACYSFWRDCWVVVLTPLFGIISSKSY